MMVNTRLLALTPVGISAMELIMAAIAMLLCHRIWIIIYRLQFHPLKSYPGPRIAAATKMYRLYYTMIGEGALLPTRLHERYGAIVRIGPNELSYIDPRAWKEIHGYHLGEDSFVKDPLMYGPDIGPNVRGLIRANDAGHARQRRIFTHAFSDKALRDQEDLLRGHVDALILKLQELTGQSENLAKESPPSIDICRFFTFLTFDIMADLTFGESFGLLKGESYVPWVSVIVESIKYSAYTLLLRAYPLLGDMLMPLVPQSIKAKRQEHLQFAIDRVDRRLQNDASKPDIWSLVLQHAEKDKISREEMYSSSYEFLIAGAETTGSLLSGLTYLLCRDKTKMEILAKEIRLLKLEEMTMAKLQSLPYLRVCIEEAMRLYPPIAGPLTRVKQKGGTNICGKYVPEGTVVGIPHMAAYHSKLHFADPMEFAPERWLQTPPERFSKDNKAVFQPFLYGPRNCLGKNLAYHEVRLILTMLLWNFDIELESKNDNWLDQRWYGFFEKRPLNLRLTLASHDQIKEIR